MVIDFDSGDIDILNFHELSVCDIEVKYSVLLNIGIFDMDILNLHELIFCVIEATF